MRGLLLRMTGRGRGMYEVYMVECRDGSLYTGISTDPERRARVHNSGHGAKYTRSRLPVTLCYREPQPDKGTALRRECAIKRLTRAEKLALIAEYQQKTHRGEEA